MKIRKSPLLIALIAIIALAILYGPSIFEEKPIEIPYPEFVSHLESGDIESAVISKDSIAMTLRDGSVISTANPGSPDIKERLLLSGAKAKDEDETDYFDEAVNFFVNCVFVVVFGGIIIKLIKTDRETFKVTRKTGVSFKDVAGLDDLKREMVRQVEILKNRSKYKGKGIRPAKGIILEGPPGNGKTLFAKALCTETDTAFIATKGADFQSALMAVGPLKIRMMFRKARRHKPCILFIDEFDSIGERRNYAGSGIDKENNRIITSMLNEMDGFTESDGVIVIAATNSFQSLDQALIRPGRFDLVYKIDNPGEKERLELVRIYTKGKSVSPELPESLLASLFSGLSAAAIESILNESAALGDGTVSKETLLLASGKSGIKLRGIK